MTVTGVSVTVATVLLLLAAPQGKADVIDVCGPEKADSARLACFDRAVAARRAGVTDTHELTDASVGLQGQFHRPRQEAVAAELPVPVVAHIAAMHRVSAKEFAFELDNGQVWQQVEAVTALDVRLQESVRITPGVLGAFFLTTAQKQTFRVKRIR